MKSRMVEGSFQNKNSIAMTEEFCYSFQQYFLRLDFSFVTNMIIIHGIYSIFSICNLKKYCDRHPLKDLGGYVFR